MPINPARPWAPRLVTFVLAALASASAAYWVLHWPRDAGRVPAAVSADVTAAQVADVAVLARVLGAAAASAGPAQSPLAGRLQLVGVVSDRNGGGRALIAVDGKPAKSFAVGTPVVDDLLLQALAPRRAVLAPGRDAPAAITLELKAPLR